jgi:hypothetical protein
VAPSYAYNGGRWVYRRSYWQGERGYRDYNYSRPVHAPAGGPLLARQPSRDGAARGACRLVAGLAQRRAAARGRRLVARLAQRRPAAAGRRLVAGLAQRRGPSSCGLMAGVTQRGRALFLGSARRGHLERRSCGAERPGFSGAGSLILARLARGSLGQR